MERVIFAVFYVIGKLLCMLIELPFWLFERQPKAEPLSLPLKLRYEHTQLLSLAAGTEKRSYYST